MMNTMMASLLNGDVFKLSIILVLLSSILMAVVKKVRNVFTKNKLKAIVYAVVLAILFGLTGLLAYHKILDDSPTNSYLAIELILLFIGIAHIFAMRTYFKELTETKVEFIGEFVLTLVFLGIALLAFVQVISRFKEGFVLVYLSAGFAFLIPLLVLKTYEYAVSIPVEIYKKWFYPINQDIKDPTSNELSNPLVISLEFKKKFGDKERSRFKVKAPEHMEFGKLFYFFVDDYNALHPEHKIEITDLKGGASGWVFYFKPHWWKGLRHIDANKTIEWNGIREENNIIVQRVEA
ncbi:TssN family type VI secretion system protein [Tamlana agarivorans]|uniref:TssN family type VI secretion system protein n=1 Tax=Pseudotamlana agarivorans TaxID=481183 RepID=A0ACC5UBQ8_9FLAO|nr:TssN family type VI secretion system protein [Tamlana agarivorans]MBU2951691.1 TssN family type VI secretion system protein [Tamlana agarivorans]